MPVFGSHCFALAAYLIWTNNLHTVACLPGLTANQPMSHSNLYPVYSLGKLGVASPLNSIPHREPAYPPLPNPQWFLHMPGKKDRPGQWPLRKQRALWYGPFMIHSLKRIRLPNYSQVPCFIWPVTVFKGVAANVLLPCAAHELFLIQLQSILPRWWNNSLPGWRQTCLSGNSRRLSEKEQVAKMNSQRLQEYCDSGAERRTCASSLGLGCIWASMAQG